MCVCLDWISHGWISLFFCQMVSVEDGGVRGPVVLDKEPEGLCEIVEQSCILEASHVRDVSARFVKRD